ncbi:MAG: hypothetical protein U0V02_02535 [Anaerolineales bacterium]
MSDVQQAIDLIKQGRKREAQPILEAHIRAAPHDIKTWFWYVETLDSLEKRIQLLEVCSKQNPNNPQVLKALEMLREKLAPSHSTPVSSPKVELYTSPRRTFEETDTMYGDEASTLSSSYEKQSWEETTHKPKSNLPNIDIPENQNVIAYIKTINSFYEPIVPYDYDKVNNERNHPDLTEFITSFASKLPSDCKYVVYGCAALVHPESGIIFGFAISMNAYFRLPERTAREVEAHFDKIFYRGRKKAEPRSDAGSAGGYFPLLDSNWSRYSTNLTASLVRKCYDYYGKRRDDNGVIHLDVENDLQKIHLPTFFDKLLDRLFPLLILVGGFALVLFILYVMNNFKISDVIDFLKNLR